MNEGTNNVVDVSSAAFELAKDTGFGSDETKFREWEKSLVRRFYEVVGLSDIPDEFLTLTKFIEAYSGVLVKSVQSDIALMQATKRLSMYKLSENIAATSGKPNAPAGDGGASGASNNPPTGYDPLAK